MERAGKEGILSVCAAGNAGFNADRSFHLPSGLESPYVISVAATDINDQLANFSNFGRSTADLAASGEDVGSTIRTNDFGFGASGTSFHAKAGASYWIAVAGKSSNTGRFLVNEQSMGTFTLEWFPTPPPFLSCFSPISGFIGSTVTLTGTNLTGVTEVLFNGQRAEFTPVAGDFQDRRLIALVPPGATTGKLTVVSPLGTASHNADFTIIQTPTLSIRKAGAGQIELSWPEANTSGFVVEVTPSLTTLNWKRVAAPVNTVAGQKVVSLSTSNQEQFYRIRKP